MTNSEILEAALRGTAADWEHVHEACKDRAQAEALGRMLEESATLGDANAKAWAHLLAEFHPGLNVKLRPSPSV